MDCYSVYTSFECDHHSTSHGVQITLEYISVTFTIYIYILKWVLSHRSRSIEQLATIYEELFPNDEEWYLCVVDT